MGWESKIDDVMPNFECTKRLLSWFEEFQSGDERLVKVLANKGALSFPHTVLTYSGEMLTRVVTSLYASGVNRVIALGVIHVGVLPKPYRELFEELLDPKTEPKIRGKRLNVFRGAFIRSEKETAFGTVPIIPPKSTWRVIRRDDAILANEFCLNKFFTVLRFGAAVLGRDVLPVLPVYIGATFDPTSGSFNLAKEIAGEIIEMLTPRTAIVLTGDLVHYGTTYSSKDAMQNKPTTIDGLETFFLPLVHRSFQLAFVEKDYQEAFRYFNDILHNDQRLLFPVISEILGAKISYEILEFHLSDFAPIKNVPPPCVVASSLVALTPQVRYA